MSLSRWVKPELSEARLARQWSAIRGRGRATTPRWVGVLAAAVVVLALVGVILVRSSPRAPAPLPAPPPDTLAFEGGDGAAVTVRAGVRVELARDARLELRPSAGRDVTLELVRGAATFVITHDPARTVIVHAGDVRIEDVGTRFTVRRDGDAVTVAVLEGAVRVQHGAAPAAELGAGETWTIGKLLPPSPTTEATTASEARDAAPTPIAVVHTSDASAPKVDDDDPAFATFKALAAAHRDADAWAALGDAGFARAVARASPAELFLLGDVARFSGHPSDATVAYDALRRRYRSDEHAGLAAFELGRLRLDRLHDPAGAAEAFADALALAPGAPYREDAESRRVEALDAAGDHDGCTQARSAYLARYPNGLYERRVGALCAPR